MKHWVMAFGLVGIVTGSAGAGAFWERRHDAAQLRVAADAIEGAIKITGWASRHPASAARDFATPDAEVLHTSAPNNLAVGPGSGRSARLGHDMIAIGQCAGGSVIESRDILLGDYTAALPGEGFVNIANRLCFWRDSGERVACPAPEPECVPAHQNGRQAN